MKVKFNGSVERLADNVVKVVPFGVTVNTVKDIVVNVHGTFAKWTLTGGVTVKRNG